MKKYYFDEVETLYNETKDEDADEWYLLSDDEKAEFYNENVWKFQK